MGCFIELRMRYVKEKGSEMLWKLSPAKIIFSYVSCGSGTTVITTLPLDAKNHPLR